MIYDFLTNAQYGAGFDPASIDATTLFGSGGDGSLQTYCKAMGYAFSPALGSQEQASSILTRWLQILSLRGGLVGRHAEVHSLRQLGDLGGFADDYRDAVCRSRAPSRETSTAFKPPSAVTVAPPADFVSDAGVVFAFSNAPLAFIGATVPPNAGDIRDGHRRDLSSSRPSTRASRSSSPTGSAAASYAPNLTPVYALTDIDFIDEKGNKDPVQVERADIFSLPTIQRVEILSREQSIQRDACRGARPVADRDFRSARRRDDPAHEICDEIVMGPLVAQTILQRELYVRTKFKFKLSWEYCLLDPMDIVTITDAKLGLSNYPGPDHLDRGGRQGSARDHGGGARISASRRRRSIRTPRRPAPISRTPASPPFRSIRR